MYCIQTQNLKIQTQQKMNREMFSAHSSIGWVEKFNRQLLRETQFVWLQIFLLVVVAKFMVQNMKKHIKLKLTWTCSRCTISLTDNLEIAASWFRLNANATVVQTDGGRFAGRLRPHLTWAVWNRSRAWTRWHSDLRCTVWTWRNTRRVRSPTLTSQQLSNSRLHS